MKMETYYLAGGVIVEFDGENMTLSLEPWDDDVEIITLDKYALKELIKLLAKLQQSGYLV